MEKNMKKFFKDLVEAPSPSGFEQAAQEVYRNFVKDYADEVKTDVHGNVIALKKGTGNIRFMVSGHADEIGMMVNYIDENGYIRFLPIGGIDPSLLPGLRVDIYGKKKYRGVIGKKPIHAMSSADMNKAPKMDELWIDFGAKDKKDAEKKISVGDFITFSKGMEMLSSHLVTTKATDNKAGVFVAGALLKELANEKTVANVYAVSSVQEEVGLRGARTSAFGIDPHVGIAVDVTVSTDYPGMSKSKFGDISLGKGPAVSVGANINPKVFELLKKAADKAKIKYQVEAAPRATGTDANAIQVTRSGVAAGLISLPNRYMHTPNEIISLNDLSDAVQLIAEFVRLIDDKTDFIPKV
ncbi:MAG: M42 family metallopeptidase [Candidatus Cloacimonetes bacterium]|jgi:tetrahedral aminopeptidase|nr:M42 family metallopeptidase [Candidatus Cloacimonadota bacterium]MBT6994604.1 M42 family metallopeptidase [Candidatus Cloacimonadota bacterium]MBT7469266.1 M42 family metallopeptidase [Candidatus Cloacimonadota bacterium]